MREKICLNRKYERDGGIGKVANFRMPENYRLLFFQPHFQFNTRLSKSIP